MLCFDQILLTHSLRKIIEITLKNLNVDIGALRVDRHLLQQTKYLTSKRRLAILSPSLILSTCLLLHCCNTLQSWEYFMSKECFKKPNTVLP